MIEDRKMLFSAMSNGAIVLTPNNRLSQQLLTDYFKNQGAQVSTKPICFPYSTFLRYLYNQLRHQQPTVIHPTLLTEHQQRQVWSTLLQASLETISDGLLGEIQEAWKRCQQWQLDYCDMAFSDTPQTHLFKKWQQTFKDELMRRTVISEEQLAVYLLQNIESFCKTNQTSVIWSCFDYYTPEQTTLQNTFAEYGWVQLHYDLVNENSKNYQFAAANPQDEYLQLIQWIKFRIEQGDTRIGVVIPDLQVQHLSLQRLFLQHFLPHEFNISLGQPLSIYPIIGHARNWLSLDKNTISNHQAKLLLHSPFLAHSCSEFLTRAQLLQNSKFLQENTIPFSSLIRGFASSLKLVNLLQKIEDYPETNTPREWGTHFKNRLNHLGFPGEYPLNSLTYQCLQRLLGLFDELSSLELITSQMSKSEALFAIGDLMTKTVFQAQSQSSPIQILGLLEASGCMFDSLWVCTMTDQTLPQKTRLSAFIPIAVQRKYSMPHALQERELQYAQQLFRRFCHTSPFNVFSYPHLVGDTPNLPSPLIAELSTLTINTMSICRTNTQLIPREENYAIPLSGGETPTGGTGLLAEQAKCPFRAFASHRLHAKTPSPISIGLDNRERGQIIHTVLESIWKNLTNQEDLLRRDGQGLNQIIDTAINNALNPYKEYRKHSFPFLIQEIEHARLRTLVLASLDWERSRPPFEIEAVEQSFTLHLEGIDFRVRIDRLDKVGEKKWVIDYKSTLPTSKPWVQERPEEPQLLFYALLDETIHTLLFLQLKTGHLLCKGFSEEDWGIKGIHSSKSEESWSEIKLKWEAQLSLLAREFVQGHCPPTPTRASICQPCDFRSLCRIT